MVPFRYPLVAVTEVRLVNLDAVAGHRVERGVVALDALDDAAAHEPCGTQTHSALVHAVAQRQLVYERLHVGHPRLHRQLGHASTRPMLTVNVRLQSLQYQR